jgi:hypothetical protein
MTRRELAPPALVGLSLAADAAGRPTLAFYLLLAAIPTLVVAGLATLEQLIERDRIVQRRFAGVLQVGSLALVILAAALRSPDRVDGVVPPVAISAAVAGLVLCLAQAIVTSLPDRHRATAPPEAPEAPALSEAA